MIHPILAETPRALLERMAVDLASTQDAFARHWLVVPGTGRALWVQQRWARLSGIAAHSQIVELRSVVEQAGAGGRPPFNRNRLELAVASALADPPTAAQLPLMEKTSFEVLDARGLSWAGQIAEAIDMGLLCRGETQAWTSWLTMLAGQKEIREAMAGHIGLMPAEEFRRAVEAWIYDWQRRGGVPRLWIQLDAGLPQALLARLVDLLDLMPPDCAHLYLLQPCPMFWGDLKTRRHWNDEEDAGPVLRPLGRSAQDLQQQIIDGFLAEGTGGENLCGTLAPEADDNLLGSLQQCIREASRPQPLPSLPQEDTSFTIHSCRSPLRELEVCRDRILQALEEDPTLRPEEILVLLANAAVMAPLATAAFQPLPVRVAGHGGALPSPVAEGFCRLLQALSGRLGLADLQQLLEEPLIAARFGLEGRSPDLIAWLKEACFRWGIDTEHRAGVQGTGEDRWNLFFALRRLGLGATVASDRRDTIVGDEETGTVPLERATGLDTALLAALARFAEALAEARREWAIPRTLPQWAKLLTTLAERFLAPAGGKDAEQYTTLLDLILPGLAQGCTAQLVAPDALLRLLTPRLEPLRESMSQGGFGITVADLGKYAGTPARFVLVAGLGMEFFPRREDRPAWHPLSENRESGDPDRRDADRHALLLALLAAEERLALIYQGGSDRDDEERPPSTPVADLMAAAKLVGGLRFHFRHGLNGFSPGAFTSPSPSGRSYSRQDYSGALVLQKQREPGLNPGLWSEILAPLEEDCIDLQSLRILAEEPCRIYTRRLGLRLPEEAEAVTQGDLLEIAGLERWSICDRLLRERLAAGKAWDENALYRRLERAGDMPPGRYGTNLWEKIREDTPKPEPGRYFPWQQPMTIPLNGKTITGQLPDYWHRDNDGYAYCILASKKQIKYLLRLRIELLCLSCAGERTVSEVTVWFRETRPLRLSLSDEADRQTLLTDMIRFYTLATRIPLPFWPETFESMERTQKGNGNEDRVLSAGLDAWREGGFGPSGPLPCDLPATRLCFRGLADPFSWAPPVDDETLPPGKSLAMRIFRLWQRFHAAFREEKIP